jgi:hypothetical protein
MERFLTLFHPPMTNTTHYEVLALRELAEKIKHDPTLKQQTQMVRSYPYGSTKYKQTKVQQLPMATPSGLFRHRSLEGLVAPNGLLVVDLDGLASEEEAKGWRDRLFEDQWLSAELAFCSPSNRGVKLFVPYEWSPKRTLLESFREQLETTWDYLRMRYELKVDEANTDLCRGCLVCHDEGVKFRYPFFRKLKLTK